MSEGTKLKKMFFKKSMYFVAYNIVSSNLLFIILLSYGAININEISHCK